MITSSISQSFLNAIAEAGFKPPSTIVPDGQYHRFPTDDEPGDNAGWYVLTKIGNLAYGACGDWRQLTKHHWSSKKESRMTAPQRKLLKIKINRFIKNTFFYSPIPKENTTNIICPLQLY